MKLSREYSLDCLPAQHPESFADYIYSLYQTAVLPIPDGNIHRFDIGKKGNRVGWYVLAEERDLQWGCCGDWRKGDKNAWTSEAVLTNEQRTRLKVIAREAESKREQSHAIAADIARMIYDTLPSASSEHPYLVRKKVEADMFLKQSDDRLVLPVFDKDMNIKSLQFISPDGAKQFLFGGDVAGGFCIVGYSEKTMAPGAKLYVAEGYATAKSIQQSTGDACLVAFNAGNLPKVCGTFKDIYDLTIIADNDESGTGEKYAKQADVPYILIPKKGMDANDYVNAGYNLIDLINPKSEQNKDTWLISGDEFIENYRPAQWIIKKWLPARGLTMLYGAPSSGKTFVVLDMLLSISTGQPCWFGRKVGRGGVVYLCGEGHEGLRKRLKVWKQERGVDTLGDFAVAQSALDLDRPEGLRQTAGQIDALPFKPAVIAIDTLNRFYSGDENDAQQIRGFIESCSELQRAYQCAVLVIHHTGVSESAQTRARGSSALRGAVETEILVQKGEDGFLTLQQTKQKDDIPEELKLCLKGHVIDGWKDEDGEPMTSATVEDISDEDKVERLQKEIDMLLDAYEFGGRKKDSEGWPAIQKSDMRKFLKEKQGWTEASVKHAFRKEPYRLAGKLIDAHVIVDKEDAWSLREKGLVSLIRLTEKGSVPYGAISVP